MKPFLFFIKSLIYFGVVNVASSKPPGISPKGFLFFISLLMFSGLTASTPHHLSCNPEKGKDNKNLLANPVIWDIRLPSAFIFAGKPKY